MRWFAALLILAVAGAAVFAAAARRFDQTVRKEIGALLARPVVARPPVTDAALASLPAPVQRWLRRAGVVGAAPRRFVRLVQAGQLRTAPDKPFLPARAQQYFDLQEPAFLWQVRVTMAGLPVRGRDKYWEGHGHMLITLSGLVPIADAKGPAIDEGTLLRFLAELIWAPSAALEPYVQWEPMDEHSARATMTWQGVTASADFTFDEQGRFVAMHAQRYFGGEADAVRQPWSCVVTQYGAPGGVEIPTAGTVTWQLPSGDFDYYRWQITALDYDVPTPFAARDWQ